MMNIEIFDMIWEISRLLLILTYASFVLHQEPKQPDSCQDVLFAFCLCPPQINDFNQRHVEEDKMLRQVRDSWSDPSISTFSCLSACLSKSTIGSQSPPPASFSSQPNSRGNCFCGFLYSFMIYRSLLSAYKLSHPRTVWKLLIRPDLLWS